MFDKDSYFIKVVVDKSVRILMIFDMGIGMIKDEFEQYFGIIVKSGFFVFKKENELKDGYDIIG